MKGRIAAILIANGVVAITYDTGHVMELRMSDGPVRAAVVDTAPGVSHVEIAVPVASTSSRKARPQ